MLLLPMPLQLVTRWTLKMCVVLNHLFNSKNVQEQQQKQKPQNLIKTQQKRESDRKEKIAKYMTWITFNI